jgi:hypothetical protein
MRKGAASGKVLSGKDKLVIHMLYLLTTRFADAYDFVLKIVQTFIDKVGSELQEQQCAEFLLIVSQLNVTKQQYNTWQETIGSFMQVMGPARFFQVLPLKLCEFDMNSLTYAQDSRSYLLTIMHSKLQRADIVFFVEQFIPLLKQLEHMRQAVLAPVSETYSSIKAKKYETLIIQIWNLLPIFCRFTSPKLAAAFSSLLEYLEPMVNRDTHGLRSLALKVFTEIINHCRTTRIVTDQIK